MSRAFSDAEKKQIRERVTEIYEKFGDRMGTGDVWDNVYDTIRLRAVQRSNLHLSDTNMEHLRHKAALMDYVVTDPAVAKILQEMVEDLSIRLATWELHHEKISDEKLPGEVKRMLDTHFPDPAVVVEGIVR